MDGVIEKGLNEYSKGVTNLSTVAAFGWLDDEGHLGVVKGAACHASMNYNPFYHQIKESKNKNLVAVFNTITAHKYDQNDVRTAFMEWVLYHSPYRHAFLDIELDLAMSKNTIIGNPEQPANYMTAGLMMTRLLWEHGNVSTTWYKFVEQGLHPSVAFLLAHNVTVKDDKVMPYTPSHTGALSGTYALNESYTLNFLQEKKYNLAESYKKHQGMATSTYRIWSGPNPMANGLSIFRQFESLIDQAAKGKKKSSSNPFAKAKTDPYEGVRGAPFMDAVELLVPHFNRYKEFFNA